jgi:hypothetical protein
MLIVGISQRIRCALLGHRPRISTFYFPKAAGDGVAKQMFACERCPKAPWEIK